MKILMYCLLALNVGVWLMYGIDKWKAKSGRWRIPEKVLLLAAFAGGSVGALAGMMMFRHKTKKAKFKGQKRGRKEAERNLEGCRQEGAGGEGVGGEEG